MIEPQVPAIELPANLPTGLDGTQAIRRAVAMLKIIASGYDQGVTLTEVSKALQLSRSTTHRILKCLVEEGLVEQEPSEHRYKVGRLTYELGLCVLRDFHATTRWAELVQTVARRTNHTTYLLARSGAEAVVIQKAEGRGLVRVIPVEVGQRRPLGVGAGAIALLSSFAPTEIERIVRSIAPTLQQFPNLTPERVTQDALEAKERGFAISAGRVFDQVVGLGFVLANSPDSQLAVSIAAPASVVDAGELQRLAQLIRAAICATTSGSDRGIQQ